MLRQVRCKEIEDKTYLTAEAKLKLRKPKSIGGKGRSIGARVILAFSSFNSENLIPR